MRRSRIKYDSALSVKELAKKNGVSEAAIQYYIRVNHIDRRGDDKKNLILQCREYLKKHPKATWREISEKTHHSESTIRPYQEYILGKKDLSDFDSEKTKKRQEIESESKDKLFAYLDTFPKEVLLEYLVMREEREESGVIQEKPKVEEVTILDGIPFKPYEEFHIPVSECIQFHSKALPENKVLSNHYECIVTFRGVEFYGLEQMYAALNYSDSPNIIKQIMNCKSGKAAKSLCKKKYADKRDWDFEEKRYRIIALCHLFKYLSVKEFRDRLRETYPQTLVECPNGKDYHFGMVQNYETNVFEGNNCSGRTLMAVRNMMKEKEDYEIAFNEALAMQELSDEEKEEIREALYGQIRYEFEHDEQVLKDSKPLFTVLRKKGIPNRRVKEPEPFIAPAIDRHSKCLVVDFDDTLFDTSADDEYRKGKKKDMDRAMEMIPLYRLYDGWRELIDWTQKNRVKIAVLSSASGKLIEKALQHFNIPCSAVIGFQPYIEKPNPILGNMLMEQLNIRQEQIIYVGNSDTDEIQARASQFRFIGAIWQSEYEGYFTRKGVQTISNPRDIIPILEKMGWSKANRVKEEIEEIRYRERTDESSSHYLGVVRCTEDFAYFSEGVPFSNQWESPAIQYDGHTFSCFENVLLYFKAKACRDAAIAEKIATLPTYSEAKALCEGKKYLDNANVRGLLEPLLLMTLRAKKQYDSAFRNALLSEAYKGKVFVYASKTDSIFGIGTEATDDVLLDGVIAWEGENLLGKWLTKTRDEALNTKTIIPPIKRRSK